MPLRYLAILEFNCFKIMLKTDRKLGKVGCVLTRPNRGCSGCLSPFYPMKDAT